jgi:hypothetical protein
MLQPFSFIGRSNIITFDFLGGKGWLKKNYDTALHRDSDALNLEAFIFLYKTFH